MNADPVVMEFFPQPQTRAQSLASLEQLKRDVDERGWGLWAVEIEREFAGFTGLAVPRLEAHFTPCTEICWRFQRRFWGRGYALEAARVALRFAFERLCLGEVVSFTAQLNERSQRLMQRLGMTHSALDDFEHPMLPAGHPLRRHILYRIQNTPALLEKLNLDLNERDGQSERLMARMLYASGFACAALHDLPSVEVSSLPFSPATTNRSIPKQIDFRYSNESEV